MKIAILDDYLDCARQFAPFDSLRNRHDLTVFTHKIPDEELPALLAEFDILLIMRERTAFPAALIRQLPQLKLIVTTGRRNDVVDMEACKAAGVTVCGTDSAPFSTAELTFALLLAAAKGIVNEHNDMQRGGWQTRVCQDLRGSTLGIIGLGRIGGLVAGYAKALGMDVIAWSQNLTEQRTRELGVGYVSRDELMSRSDFITLHLRLVDRTRHLVAHDQLAKMKDGAWIINTSRAQIIDMPAMLPMLRSGRINAALDVYEVEPLPFDNELRSLPNVILSPHKGYVSQDNFGEFYGQTFQVLMAWLEGKPVNIIV